MEQFIKGCETDGGSLQSANCAIDLANDTNGQTETTSIVLYERSGGSYVAYATANTTKKNLERIQLGIKELKVDNLGWLQQVYLKPLGTKASKARQKFHADIVEPSFTHPKEAHDSARNRVRCLVIKELIYLLENNLITL